jgi:hypothetical protein
MMADAKDVSIIVLIVAFVLGLLMFSASLWYVRCDLNDHRRRSMRGDTHAQMPQ